MGAAIRRREKQAAVRAAAIAAVIKTPVLMKNEQLSEQVMIIKAGNPDVMGEQKTRQLNKMHVITWVRHFCLSCKVHFSSQGRAIEPQPESSFDSLLSLGRCFELNFRLK